MGCGGSTQRGPFAPKKLGEETKNKLRTFFNEMDDNKDGKVTKEEAFKFFSTGKFGKLSASAMFNEVDKDTDNEITLDEFISFWEQVRKSGYKEEEIMEEVTEIMKGGQWVDWKDERNVGMKPGEARPSLRSNS
mmetsp:Transcript_49468/g.107730  ORF Transcript_49468/g.107730 Transcript_49468/m.107730 type:complete len:134 (-) Transcript_49468:170-571(-)